MAGRKRAAEESASEKRETRSAKVPKTEARKGARSTGRKGGARSSKKSMGATAFKSRAQPLYVNITHTEPSIEVDAAEIDSGFVDAISLVSTSFATGSFGWKGNKRLTVELPKLDGQEEGEKVHVALTINAVVLGSKGSKDEGEEGETAGETAGEKEAEGENAVEEPAQEKELSPVPAAVEEGEGEETVSS